MEQTLNSAIRLALVTGNLNLGGATTFLCNLAGELVRRGVSVKVFNLERIHPLASDFEAAHIPVFIADNGRRIYEDRLKACAEAVREFAPTCVVGCLAPPSFEILRYVPEGIGRVGMVQSDDPGVYRALSHFHNYIDGLVGVSQTTARRLGEMRIFQGKQVAYIPYGVPMPEALSACSPGEGPLRIVYLGRLDEDQKRVRIFPRIYKALCESGISFCWTIAGDGPERAYLEEALKGGRPDQVVTFLGKVSYQDVPALLDRQDIFLLPSSFEGLPLSLLEAMSHGVLPVMSDLESGIPEVVNASNGRLVPVDDLDGYARAIIELCHHREAFAAMRLKARSAVYPAFTIATMADRWMELAALWAGATAQWDARPAVKTPIGMENSVLFSMPGRVIRRMAKQWF